MNRIAYISIIILLVGCNKSAVDSPVTVDSPPAANSPSAVDSPTEVEPKVMPRDAIATGSDDDTMPWSGIYVSTSEIEGFSGTTMSLGPIENGKREYRKHFYSCMSMDLAKLPPIIETNGRELTITERYQFRMPDGTLDEPLEYKTKYTRMNLNDRIVLLRDDALKQFELNNKLYDYGVLVKISDDHDSIEDLSKAPHPSIRTLYENPDAEWSDPFVHGANSRK